LSCASVTGGSGVISGSGKIEAQPCDDGCAKVADG